MKPGHVASFLLLLVASIPILPVPGLSHHGTNASYDNSQPTTLTGIVTDFVWKNPHCFISFDVTDTAGNVVQWAAEMNSPGVLDRAGWTRRTLQAGDEITLTVSPSRAGTPVGVVDRSQPMFKNGEQVLGTGEFD